jgi:hypothetical protein
VEKLTVFVLPSAVTIFMNDPVQPTIKTCPRCGRQFECLHDVGCWCFDYTLSSENTELLNNEFNNCLCPGCLPLYAENNAEER